MLEMDRGFRARQNAVGTTEVTLDKSMLADFTKEKRAANSVDCGSSQLEKELYR